MEKKVDSTVYEEPAQVPMRPSRRQQDEESVEPTRGEKFWQFMKKWGLPLAVGLSVFTACVASFFFPPVALFLAPVLTPAIELLLANVIPASIGSLTAGFVAFGVVTAVATAVATVATRLAMKGVSKLYDFAAQCLSKNDGDETPEEDLKRQGIAPRRTDKESCCEPTCFKNLFARKPAHTDDPSLSNEKTARSFGS